MEPLLWFIRLSVVQLIIALGGALAVGSVSYNVGIFVLALWAVYSDMVDPMRIYLVMLFVSMVYDWIWLGVYAEDIMDANYSNKYIRTQEFSLAMTIIGHILKPVSMVLGFLVYRERGGGFDLTFSEGGNSGGNANTGNGQQPTYA
eukprot:TRINITY_DN378_c0_g1_i1.p1 TRINITY_DN378_c0_g1~~TRINITY_DN378_c0_g1_i1.p1  ORF type:complete len:146 (-),score=33.56 TRINITY_DN378_c0_g1_i1:89-526(-)